MLTPDTLAAGVPGAAYDAVPDRPIVHDQNAACCPQCGHGLDMAWLMETLGARWLSKRETLHFLGISNTQRARLERLGVLPPASFALGMRSGRWRLSELDAVLDMARPAKNAGTARASVRREARRDPDAAVAQVLKNINGGAEPSRRAKPPASEWR